MKRFKQLGGLWFAILSAGITGLGACTGIRRAEDVQLITTDLDNFWAAYPAVLSDTANAAAVFEQRYFAPGSPGLREYYENRYQSQPLRFARAVTQHPRFYSSARPTMLAIAAQKPQILAAFRRLQALYPPVRFNNIYFLVGGFRGSTAQREGLLIGVEYLVVGPDVDTSELTLVQRNRCAPVTAVPAMVTHEMIHNTQQPADGTLLSAAIREGMGDFVAELVTGIPGTNARLHPYGQAHERELWQTFRQQMHGRNTDNWLANPQQETAQKPCDLGYYVGYKICQAYYNKAVDKQQAVADMLTTKDFNGFLAQSAYGTQWVAR
ncbi:DUF2268 domain-containing putative Zn-dependent protease [Hymenobacter sp. IS2118]|uniref:gliding motility protein GldB-related protein n=1 Tax=Hymenobacter sp. IS2118 TaxID=1505605 RepID=UPI00068C8A78|nr:DUF2268 domain-containing putative Zn-dependent protease [Hymenobacter sp. IS2118]